jgi:hypothetical protein
MTVIKNLGRHTGVPRELAKHALEVNKTARPIKQKLRRFAKDRKQAIEVEVCKLFCIYVFGSIHEWNLKDTRH